MFNSLHVRNFCGLHCNMLPDHEVCFACKEAGLKHDYSLGYKKLHMEKETCFAGNTDIVTYRVGVDEVPSSRQ